MHGCHRPVLEGRPCGVSRRFHRAASFIACICSRRYHLQRMHGTIAMPLLCTDVPLQLASTEYSQRRAYPTHLHKRLTIP